MNMTDKNPCSLASSERASLERPGRTYPYWHRPRYNCHREGLLVRRYRDWSRREHIRSDVCRYEYGRWEPLYIPPRTNPATRKSVHHSLAGCNAETCTRLQLHCLPLRWECYGSVQAWLAYSIQCVYSYGAVYSAHVSNSASSRDLSNGCHRHMRVRNTLETSNLSVLLDPARTLSIPPKIRRSQPF